MTAGEKINFYRKKLGLSQEELGQKLLVSRQTISLWEKGQTVPTIDNLIRLKEIFGVSVDEILGCEAEKESKPDLPVPKESYKFNYSKEEINQIFKQSNKPIIMRIVLLAFFAVIFLALFSIDSESVGLTGVLIGVLFASITIWVKTLFINSKNSKKAEERIVQSFYEFKVYDNYFTVTVLRNGEVKSNFKFGFNDIEKFIDAGAFLLLVINGQSFILRKDSLVPNSIFTLLAKSNPEKTVVNKKGMTATKFILNILFVATLFSLFIPLIISGKMGQTQSWAFFATTIIPVLSIIFGIIFKHKGYKCKKNIVAGIIFAFLLLIYGFLSTQADKTIDNSEWALLRAEETIGIDLPECESIQTVEMQTETTSPTKGYIYYTSRITFDENRSNDFEKEVTDSQLWLEQMPNNFAGIISPFSSIYTGDYRLIYNVDTNEFNSIPEEEGTYRFLYLCYDFETNYMIIDEYDIEYTK